MDASNKNEFIKQLKYQVNDLKTAKRNLMNILCEHDNKIQFGKG